MTDWFAPGARPMRMFLLMLGVVALAAVPVQADADDEAMVTVQAVVRLADPGTDPDLLAALHGAEVTESLVPSRGLHVVSRAVKVGMTDLVKESAFEAKDLVKDLESSLLVAWAMVRGDVDLTDSRAHAWPDGLPRRTFLDADNAVMDYLNVELVHGTSQGDGVVVAVLDTGIDADHALLRDRVLTGWDLVDDDRDPDEVADGVDGDGDGRVDEAHGHGTFVSGVVAQVAPGAEILPIRVLDADGRGEPAVMVEGIRLAVEEGADVINVSASLLDDHEPGAMQDAIKDARRANVQVVAASGNRASTSRVFPAGSSGVLAVAAMEIGDESQVAPFSAYGSWVEVAAPGVDMISAYPGGAVVSWSGTSVAAPVVAAQVALLRSFDPTASTWEVLSAIHDTARAMSGDRRVEHGTVDLVASVKALD